MDRIEQVVEFQARLYGELKRLSKQHVRSSDQDGLMHLRLSGNLEVEELSISEEALALGAEELSARLESVFNDTLARARELALSRLGVHDSQWESLGLPVEEAEPRKLRDQGQ